MTGAALLEEPLITRIKWRENVRTGDYQIAECTVEREFRLDPEGDLEGQRDKIRSHIRDLEWDVKDALGIKDRETSAVELLEDELGAKRVESTTSDTLDRPPHDPTLLAKPYGQMTQVEKAQNSENKAWATARLNSHPQEFFDNRADIASGKVSAKSPQFKHKDTKIGVWVD